MIANMRAKSGEQKQMQEANHTAEGKASIRQRRRVAVVFVVLVGVMRM